MYTVGSLFSGIGGLDLAAHWAGFTTSWFVEREPFCQKVLAKHWPDVPCHSDVFEAHDLPHVDVIVGGFPCQPFSVAGNRKGADDERYLLPEMLRIISEVKPYAVLFENVPGFPSLNDGTEFKYLLRALAEMGFDAEWGHLRASDSGAPHQRERWFLVAFMDDTQSRAGGYDRANIRKTVGTQHTLTSSSVRSRTRQNVVNPIRDGNGNTWTGRTLHYSNWNSSQEKRRRIIQQHGIIPSNRRSTQSRFRRTANGLPSGMDFVGWPARPGENQHAYEPSRVTSAKTPNRAARLKALGNAVVPQVAYPLFAAIHEWLTAQDAERIA